MADQDEPGKSIDLDEEIRVAPVAGEFRYVEVGDLESAPYDSRPSEDRARRQIAYLLIWLLIGICAASYVSVWLCWITTDNAIRLLQILLGPVVALVSAATGFYYGSKQNTPTK